MRRLAGVTAVSCWLAVGMAAASDATNAPASSAHTARRPHGLRERGATAAYASRTGPLPAAPVRRDAGLVVCVGLDDYARERDLRRAQDDARAVADELQRRRFRVVRLTGADVTRARVLAALELQPAVFYFAGHARADGLVLGDGRLPLAEARRYTDVMLLDGCAVGGGLRSTGRTRVYAAGRDYAFETGTHGLFTESLLNWLSAGHPLCGPGMARHIEQYVIRETGGWQRPAYGYLSE